MCIRDSYDIDAAANIGKGEIYVLAFMAAGGSEYLVAGRYIDKYECRDGDWRISSRQYIFDWSRTGDDANNDPNGLFASLTYRGKHTMEDISYDSLS